MGTLCPGETGRVQSSIMNTLIEHTSHQDNRVRTAAFNALVSINFFFGGKGIDILDLMHMDHFSVDDGCHNFVVRNGTFISVDACTQATKNELN